MRRSRHRRGGTRWEWRVAHVVGVTHRVHTAPVKAVTITIPAELDAEAAAEARRLGISKSALIRRGLEAVLPSDRLDTGSDPWRDLAGFGSRGLSVAPGEIDTVGYES
ncbi:MAG: ribbon-helix-helix protein, CopG family [Acidimicrobiia bacterium]|nr:ribbon-helix-helix protein, CopG family [Acidimicrobiia bacterium]